MQISMFDGEQPFKINKPIRLIELFAGYGSQALALKYLGVPFEHHRICEWAVKSIQAYKDLHFSEDNTDYSAELTEKQVYEKLYSYGISADYNKPMTLKEITRLKEGKARHEVQGHGFGWKPIDPNGGGYFARTIKTESGYRPDTNFIVKQSGEYSRKTDERCKHPNGERLQGVRQPSNECSSRIQKRGADGIMVGTSEKFNAGMLKDISRSITTEGKNGVVEWKK